MHALPLSLLSVFCKTLQEREGDHVIYLYGCCGCLMSDWRPSISCLGLDESHSGFNGPTKVEGEDLQIGCKPVRYSNLGGYFGVSGQTPQNRFGSG